jgi:CPA2 family monovalent cation:H+ antiporter-2
VGQTASRILNEFGVQPVVLDLNVDTVRSLSSAGKPAFYGDATRRDLLEAAGIRDAKFLLITVPDVLARTVAILTAKDLNPELYIIVRARYLQERAWLEEMGATDVCTEEGEVAIGLSALLLRKIGAPEDRIRAEIARIKTELNHRETS